ncbi:MAG: M23 family metallopeptidase [Desulfuromonadaceae bacterium]|nr:M23 family metallopeptidase [Desulfuromonadaceae bacterium]
MYPLRLILLTLFFCIPQAVEAGDIESHDKNQTIAVAASACFKFNDFSTRIRDSRISRADARHELPGRLEEVRTEYYRRGGQDYSPSDWIFPVAGYDAGTIGTGKNHGFIPQGYDYFSGNRHGGHPAYDIFIRDRNQDGIDDRSGSAVSVLSMTGGIVVALEKEWHRGSPLRGGKYIWVYDPANELLVYYAHNEKLFVETGTIVKPGDTLATVGRSGLNAAKRRSPTHLHFSVFSVETGTPVPKPVFRELQHARSAPA